MDGNFFVNANITSTILYIIRMDSGLGGLGLWYSRRRVNPGSLGIPIHLNLSLGYPPVVG